MRTVAKKLSLIGSSARRKHLAAKMLGILEWRRNAEVLHRRFTRSTSILQSVMLISVGSVAEHTASTSARPAGLLIETVLQ